MFSITGIIGLITGLAGPLASLAGKLTDLQLAKVAAQSDHERMNIDAQISESHDRMMVLQAEAGNRLNAIMRFLLALGPMLFLNKVFIFDKVLGSFMGHSKTGDMWGTDALDSNLWGVVVAVLSFYFLYDIAASWRRK